MAEALFILATYFLITVIVEAILVFAVFRRRDYLYYSFLCNLLTNPALNFILLVATNILDFSLYLPVFIVLEVAIVFIEAFIYQRLCAFRFTKALALSLLLNAASCATGLALNR